MGIDALIPVHEAGALPVLPAARKTASGRAWNSARPISRAFEQVSEQG